MVIEIYLLKDKYATFGKNGPSVEKLLTWFESGSESFRFKYGDEIQLVDNSDRYEVEHVQFVVNNPGLRRILAVEKSKVYVIKR